MVENPKFKLFNGPRTYLMTFCTKTDVARYPIKLGWMITEAARETDIQPGQRRRTVSSQEQMR